MNGTVILDRNIENGQPYIRKECAAVCFSIHSSIQSCVHTPLCTYTVVCSLAELSFGFHRIDFCGYENENFCVKIIVLQLYYKLFIVGEGSESCIVYVKY